jgi:uncharacterized protein (TIGR03083 family)
MIHQLQDLRALVTDASDRDLLRESRCPGWRVADLMAHCEIILVALVSESARPHDGAPEIDRVDVYRQTTSLASGGDSRENVDKRIRDGAVAFADSRRLAQLATWLQFVIDGVIGALHDIPGDRVVIRPPNYPRMTHRELVASRLVEIGVHTSDIAHALGKPDDLAPPAAEAVVGIFDVLLGEPLPDDLKWDATRYILCATGRSELMPDERRVLGPLATRIPLPFFT